MKEPVGNEILDILDQGDIGLLVSTLRENPQILKNEEASLLYYVSDRSSVRKLAALLVCGANPNTDWIYSPSGTRMASCLAMAVARNNYTMVNLLILFGADVNYITPWNTSLLDEAYKIRAKMSVLALLEAGVALETSTQYQTSDEARLWFDELVSVDALVDADMKAWLDAPTYAPDSAEVQRFREEWSYVFSDEPE